MNAKVKSAVAAHPPRIKLDLKAGYSSISADAQDRADERFADNKFAASQRILDEQPSALSTGTAAVKSPLSTPRSFDVHALTRGQVYAVPLAIIDPNPVGARHFYRGHKVEEIVESLTNTQQDVAVNGFIKGDRVELIDGGTRLRAARSAGLATLDVKIDPPPKDLKEQFKRSMLLNDLRTDHTQLDMAVNIERLLTERVYANAEECGNDLGYSKSEISMFRRVAGIPERLLQKMNDHDKTSGISIPYEISGIFAVPEFASDPDKFTRIAEDVIDEVQAKDLSRDQTKALIAAKLQGPKSRLRPETIVVKFGVKTGTVKLFPTRGQLDFSIKGLTPGELADVKERVEKALAGQLPLAG